MRHCRFYLGTHRPHWLSRIDAPPLFVSRRTLCKYKKPPIAATCWALDSGGFTELSMFGKWETTADQYIAEVRRWRDDVGNLDWAAAMDWMCEPFIVAKTGLSVEAHQWRTVQNYLLLRSRAPEVDWLPVVQGWTHADYMRCVELYGREGIDLRTLPAVGLGSVCRRQHTTLAEDVIRDLSAFGIRVHAFGFKVDGLIRCHQMLASADSMAWSKAARNRRMLKDCKHSACNNCRRWAYVWRDRLVNRIERNRNKPRMADLYSAA